MFGKVLVIGNAIIDMIVQSNDEFLQKENIQKSSMELVSEKRIEYLQSLVKDTTILSGGSGANTAAGIASFGLDVEFIGKVNNDYLGKLFVNDISNEKVTFNTDFSKDCQSTASCLVLITPDGERTLNTYLGACSNLSVEDIKEDNIKTAKTILLEGYLFDPIKARDAALKAINIANRNDIKVAISLSDANCIDRHRELFNQLIVNKNIDIILANEDEINSLYQTNNLDVVISKSKESGITTVCTRSEKDVVLINQGEVFLEKVMKVDRVVDSTGAGDLFAAGFLAGFNKNLDNLSSIRLGIIAANHIIKVVGARSKVSLKNLAEQKVSSLS